MLLYIAKLLNQCVPENRKYLTEAILFSKMLSHNKKQGEKVGERKQKMPLPFHLYTIEQLSLLTN